MDLKCYDNAGAELGLTIDTIYQPPLAYPPPPRDTLIKVTDNTGRIRTYRRNRFIELNPHCCHDCYKDTLGSPKDYYRVYDEVWYQYGLGDQPGMLCVNCLEKRMGHPLQALQLMAIPLNTYVNPYTSQIMLEYVLTNLTPLARTESAKPPGKLQNGYA